MKYPKPITNLITIGIIILFVTGCGEGGVDGTGNTDPNTSIELQLFQSCFALAATNECSNRDFNGDGFINYVDLSLLKAAKRFDLSQDGYVDLRLSNENPDRTQLSNCLGSEDVACAPADFNGDKVVNAVDLALFEGAALFDLNSNQSIDLRKIADIIVDYSKDLDILQTCLFKMPEGDCASSDVNSDQVIDFADTQSFIEAARFDLNGDSLIDYSNDNTEQFPNEPKNEDLLILSNCFSADPSVIVNCKQADFNNDNTVDLQDFSMFRSGSKYDLDQDGFVDLRVLIQSQDFTYFKACFGRPLQDECRSANLNDDDTIDITDFFIFRDSIVFDLNHDFIVDLHGTEADSDRDFFENCLSLTSDACLPADFNQDGIITNDDLTLFLEASKFDFSKDGFVDLRVRDASKSHDKFIIDTCSYFRTLGTKCMIADLNQDGFVDADDIKEFKASARFDLNKDQVVDLNDTPNNADLIIFNECFSTKTADDTSCIAADFNANGIVDISDLFLFRNSNEYDVNLDGIIDLRGTVPQ